MMDRKKRAGEQIITKLRLSEVQLRGLGCAHD